MKTSTNQLPQWLERRYHFLWDAFKDSPFTMDSAFEVLKEKNKDNKKPDVAVFLSELRKSGRLSVLPDEKDNRRKIYTLKPPEKIIAEALSINKEKIGRGEIESILKKAADLIRTRVDYKFILVLLFMKRVSDKWAAEYDKAYKDALKDGLSEKQAVQEAKSSAYHDFNLPEEYLWDNMRKAGGNFSEVFSKALKSLADNNRELRDILDSVDFMQFTRSRENTEILRQLVELFSERKLHHVSADILGDAYEWILRYFAPTKAKEGEIYTPREVVDLMIKILKPEPGAHIYDPACGSAGMLISSYKYVDDKFGKSGARRVFLYGQEVNQKTIALAKLNMYVHDIIGANLTYGDTLLYPKYKDADGVKKFDIVIANPPWNQDGYDEDQLKKGEFWKKRFTYGFTPSQSADWAWIQHMLASAKDRTGRVGIIIDNGCLFRGGKEGAIRTAVLEADIVESVILLPEKLFYNTGAPGAIMILNKNKDKSRAGKVLFINAASEFGKHPEVRKLNIITDKNIAKIAGAYEDFKNSKGFSRAVPIEEIKGNDYNLNVTLYVFPEEEIEDIDVEKEWRELKAIEQDASAIDKKLEGYLREIG